MRKFVAVVLIATLLGASACANKKTIDGVTYDTYGLLNMDEKKNPDIQYEVVWGNVFWGIFLFGTVMAPLYFFGFSMWEPVDKNRQLRGRSCNKFQRVGQSDRADQFRRGEP